jgi:clan AA aspartic protease
MGTFRVAVEVGDPQGRRWTRAEALVDTGATYTWLSESLLREVGVEPTFQFPFVLADGRRIERGMAETQIRLDGQQRTTLVVFGDAGTETLLGAYTLEGFGLSVDPVNRRLVPVPGFLMQMTAVLASSTLAE